MREAAYTKIIYIFGFIGFIFFNYLQRQIKEGFYQEITIKNGKSWKKSLKIYIDIILITNYLPIIDGYIK